MHVKGYDRVVCLLLDRRPAFRQQLCDGRTEAHRRGLEYSSPVAADEFQVDFVSEREIRKYGHKDSIRAVVPAFKLHMHRGEAVFQTGTATSYGY